MLVMGLYLGVQAGPECVFRVGLEKLFRAVVGGSPAREVTCTQNRWHGSYG